MFIALLLVSKPKERFVTEYFHKNCVTFLHATSTAKCNAGFKNKNNRGATNYCVKISRKKEREKWKVKFWLLPKKFWFVAFHSVRKLQAKRNIWNAQLKVGCNKWSVLRHAYCFKIWVVRCQYWTIVKETICLRRWLFKFITGMPSIFRNDFLHGLNSKPFSNSKYCKLHALKMEPFLSWFQKSKICNLEVSDSIILSPYVLEARTRAHIFLPVVENCWTSPYPGVCFHFHQKRKLPFIFLNHDA